MLRTSNPGSTKKAQVKAGDQLFEPFSILPGDLSKGLMIVVDHATADLPTSYERLGLDEQQLERHIAFDIGVRAVAEMVHKHLNVPVVQANFSRLLIDPNRGEDDPTLIMRISDGAIIPRSAAIDGSEIDYRKRAFYFPYHEAIMAQIDSFLSADIVPIILSLHSFTPTWRGAARAWHAGVLWDLDPRFALPLIQALKRDKKLIVGDNQPYTGKLKGDCMYRHGTARGIPHALLEIRQDLISETSGQNRWSERISGLLTELLDNETVIAPCRELRHYGCTADKEE